MHYSPAKGLPVLCQAIGSKHGVPSEQDFVTSSAASSMFLVMEHLLTQPGDKVIIADPVDPLFQMSVEAAGGIVCRYKLHPPNPHDPSRAHCSFDITEVEALISKGTKVIGICNPHNPVERVWNRDELEALADLAIRHNLQICCDDCSADISFAKFVSMMQMGQEAAARTYSVMGFSSYGYWRGFVQKVLLLPPLGILTQSRESVWLMTPPIMEYPCYLMWLELLVVADEATVGLSLGWWLG